MVLAVAAVVVGSWSKAPPLLAARSAHAVVATGDALYALGGSGAGGDAARRRALRRQDLDGRDERCPATG